MRVIRMLLTNLVQRSNQQQLVLIYAKLVSMIAFVKPGGCSSGLTWSVRW